MIIIQVLVVIFAVSLCLFVTFTQRKTSGLSVPDGARNVSEEILAVERIRIEYSGRTGKKHVIAEARENGVLVDKVLPVSSVEEARTFLRDGKISVYYYEKSVGWGSGLICGSFALVFPFVICNVFYRDFIIEWVRRED